MLVQWRMVFEDMWKREITGDIRKFDEAVHEDPIRIRGLAMWQAEEMMQREMVERDNLSSLLTFLCFQRELRSL
jgi:hypothetical protein